MICIDFVNELSAVEAAAVFCLFEEMFANDNRVRAGSKTKLGQS